MQEVYIVEAVRSPIGRRKGALSGLMPADLLGAVQKAARQAKFLEARLRPEPRALAGLGDASQRLANVMISRTRSQASDSPESLAWLCLLYTSPSPRDRG